MYRTYVRYKAKQGALVAFLIPGLPPIARVRRLLDISRGGLAFQYLSSERQKYTSLQVDLSWFKSLEPVVSRLPCRIVHDIGENHDIVKCAQFRRCGLQFEALSKEQESQLDAFIQDYTEAEIYGHRNQQISILKRGFAAEKR